MDKQITCKDVSISYANKALFAPLTCSWEKGKLHSIKGLNGSGKSSLLKVICGINPNYNGTVCIHGKDIKKIQSSSIAQQVSYCGTRTTFVFAIPVYEFLANAFYKNQSIWSTVKESELLQIRSCLSKLDIEHFYDKNIQTLSDGELQQVMISYALLRNTDFIILDEPTAFLDYVNREKIWNILRQLANEGKGILIASHDLSEIDTYADSCIELIKP